MSIQFPNVPAIPGVPLLKRATLGAAAAAGTLVSASSAIVDASPLISAISPMLGATALNAALSIGDAASAISNGLTGIASAALTPALSSLNTITSGIAAIDPALASTISGITSTVSAIGSQVGQILGGNPASALTGDGDEIKNLSNQGWGLFTNDGDIALDADNVTAVSYRAEYRTSDYPLQEGSFESYDKVQLPFECVIRLSKGGPLADRQDFVSRIEEIRGDRDLYIVATPEVTYSDLNIADVTIDRSQENGAGIIIADVHLREIRMNATVAFSKAKDPSGVSPYSNGSVQAAPAPANAGEVQ